MKLTNKYKLIALFSVLFALLMGCNSSPSPESSTGTLTEADLLGKWEIESEFTYKEDGVIYGKAKDVFIFTKGASDNSVFLEVQVMLTETTSDTPEDFKNGAKTLYLNETVVSVSGNEISLDGKSPYVNPSSLTFTFDGNDKTEYSWDGLVYKKVN